MVAEASAEELDTSVVEGQHSVLLRLAPPEIDHFGESVRMSRRQITALRRVLRHVVELPVVIFERGSGDVPGHRLPALVINRPMSPHLKVLSTSSVRGADLVEGVRDRNSRQGHLLETSVHVG